MPPANCNMIDSEIKKLSLKSLLSETRPYKSNKDRQELGDTVKTAKAINKSGTELKPVEPYKSAANKPKPQPPNKKLKLEGDGPEPQTDGASQSLHLQDNSTRPHREDHIRPPVVAAARQYGKLCQQTF